MFILAGARHLDRLRTDPRVQAFFVGAGSAVIGAIAGSAIPLGLELAHLWQLGVLGLAAVWLLALRRGVVPALVAAARAALATEARPIDDIRSTAKYRAAVAANLVEEFLQQLV